LILKGKPLIIVSHARSGSHFLINSIRQNADNLFGVQNPAFGLDSLLVPGDDTASNNFLQWYRKTTSENKTPIIEAKCLLEDCVQFVKKMPKDRADVKIIDHILKEGIFINIIRDPRESLLSWYKLSKSGGAMTFSASNVRLAKLTYKDFYKLTNIHKLPHKDFSEYDTSTVKYCAYHHYSWKKYVTNNKGYFVYYQDLNNNFDNSIFDVFSFLKKNYEYYKEWPKKCTRPPNAYKSRYYRKIGKIIRKFENIFYSKFNKKIFKFFLNFDLHSLKNVIESSFFASQIPTIEKDYKPSNEINEIILKEYNKAYKDYSGIDQGVFK